MAENQTRCGFVTLLGAPNAGKSTLVNKMVGAKVSIVSPKVQTTRSRVRGIAVKGDCELVLVDTPGIFKPKRRLDRAMVAAAWSEAEYADARLLIVDAKRGLNDETSAIVDSLVKSKMKAVLVLNKIDLVKPEKLLNLSAKLNESQIFSSTFMVSAENGDGVSDLFDYLAGKMPEGPFMFPPDDISDLPNRLLAAEITREKLFLNLRDELPYHLTVETELWKEEKGGVKIHQTIYVDRVNQRQIILGRQGSMIKQIGTQARVELEDLFGCRVHLFLFVKVRENWGDDPARYREWGLVFNA